VETGNSRGGSHASAHTSLPAISVARSWRVRLRNSKSADRIEYRSIDLTSEEQLATLSTAEFDAAVCNMALMDIASITPLLRTISPRNETPGRFIFSIPHPASIPMERVYLLSGTTTNATGC
jgi:hypothetical protein